MRLLKWKRFQELMIIAVFSAGLILGTALGGNAGAAVVGWFAPTAPVFAERITAAASGVVLGLAFAILVLLPVGNFVRRINGEPQVPIRTYIKALFSRARSEG